MKLDSVRELKMTLTPAVAESAASFAAVRSFGVAARSSARPAHPRTFALGIAPQKKKGDFALAVRIQNRAFEGSLEVERLKKRAKGEIDIRYIGRVAKRVPWNQKIVRPLQIGLSAGHFQITAGTLGAFVRAGAGNAVLILSNNHVLANENAAANGDAILQPGDFDHGRNPQDKIAVLTKFIALVPGASNTVDCAVATVTGIAVNLNKIRGLGKLAGLRPNGLLPGDHVAKLGRTTGLTKGRVTAIELDNVVITYDIGDLRFDDQIEIEGAGTKPFSQGGDSGSLIVDASRHGAALLFAGGDQGGSNGQGLTYGNPIQAVLAALGVQLLF